ncbi:hypothetical protein QFZ27_001672 [Inquilinus ginsengisoli]|uniref:hypothetical protein n=1 Tax=Inquilinus ginsengisoli TaxID=363840 RepID=UPI003D1CF176
MNLGSRCRYQAKPCAECPWRRDVAPEGLRPADGSTAVGNAIATWRRRPAVLQKIALVRFQPVEVLWSRALAGP